MSVQRSQVVVGLVLAAAAVGLFVGTRGTRVTSEARHQTLFERARGAEAGAVAVPGAVGPAVAWRDLPSAARGPNAGFVNALGKLDQTPPEPEVKDGRDARLAATLAARAGRRAYDGAPPRIPHAIEERSVTACVACHEHGLVVNDRVAPRMSHPVYASCTQCHATMDKPMVEASTSPRDNGFVGTRPHAGTRYLPGSPPVMPHPRKMREVCASCHGPLGPPGLRTTHPERQSCEQCHAPAPGPQQDIFHPAADALPPGSPR